MNDETLDVKELVKQLDHVKQDARSFVDAGILGRLKKLLKLDNYLFSDSLYVLNELALGGEARTIVEHGFVSLLAKQLDDTRYYRRQESAFALIILVLAGEAESVLHAVPWRLFHKHLIIFASEGEEYVIIARAYELLVERFEKSPEDLAILAQASANQLEALKFSIHDEWHMLLWDDTERNGNCNSKATDCFYESDLFFDASTRHVRIISYVFHRLNVDRPIMAEAITEISEALHYVNTEYEYFKGYLEYSEFCGHAAWFLGEYGAEKDIEMLEMASSIPREIILRFPDGGQRTFVVDVIVQEAICKIRERVGNPSK